MKSPPRRSRFTLERSAGAFDRAGTKSNPSTAPIVCGGVLVEPGDVIVVPRAHAKEVAEYARATLDGDKAGRRQLYKKLGLLPDDSVK
jgi:regulator of RNase E activity RraA